MIRVKADLSGGRKLVTMAVKEGRLSRWARLKQKGGADEVDTAEAETALEAAPSRDESLIATSANGDVMIAPDPRDLPGGDFRRNTIPVMAPLGGIEDEDTDFEAASPDALALLAGDEAHNAAPGVSPVDPGEDAHESDGEEERELTGEEQEIVASLPPIESLGRDSDFTPFLSGKVPEFIRRKALSVLWRSDPLLANLDGLNDYDEDYNLIDTLINAASQSNYKVGKGMPGSEDKGEDGINDESEEGSGESITQNTPEETSEEASDEVADKEVDTEASENSEDESEGAEDDDEIPLALRSIRDVRKPGA